MVSARWCLIVGRDAEGGVTGSLIVAAFDNLAAAKAWGADDPYVAAGVYANVDVQPFLPVRP